MALSPQDKTQIQQAGILSVIAVLALVFAPLPQYGVGIRNLKHQIVMEERILKQELDGLNKEELRIDRIPALKAELEEREPEIRKYEARLPKSEKVPALYRDIDRFKQKANLEFDVQTRLDPVDNDDYRELPIRLEVRGDFDSIATFINQLERNQRFAQVKELEITEQPRDNRGEEDPITEYTLHDAKMVISTFMFNDQVVEAEAREKTAITQGGS